MRGVAPWSARAEAGNAAIDNGWIEPAHGCLVGVELRECVRLQIRDEDIRPTQELFKDRRGCFMAKVQGNGALIPVADAPHEAVLAHVLGRHGTGTTATRITTASILDFDHIGTEVT